MRKIPLLQVDDQKVFDDIAATKRQPRRRYLQAVRLNVLSAYIDYENAVPEVGSLPKLALTEDQRKALLHAFEVETAPMRKLRGDLLNRISVARCPLCGISESSTLDHYLPKELNPSFAVFSKNLVPCCGVCNTKKRDKILDYNKSIRLFLHPYFDDIPQSLFVRLNVTLLPNAMNLRYSIFQPPDVNLRTFSQLKSHFQILGLANRFRLMALEHLRAQYRSLARLYGDIGDANCVATNLSEKAKDFEEEYGNNYWLTVLYHTLASCEQFCDGGFEVLKKIQ